MTTRLGIVGITAFVAGLATYFAYVLLFSSTLITPRQVTASLSSNAYTSERGATPIDSRNKNTARSQGFTAADAKPSLNNGFISINFDDGFKSAFQNGMPILDAAGIKTTHYIITGVLGRKPYISLEDVKTLRIHGHEIGAHTVIHPHLADIPQTEVLNQIMKSKQFLEDNGLGPIETFAYPYGSYDQKVLEMARSASLKSARTTHDGLNDAYTPALELKGNTVTSSTTFIDLKNEIDEARKEKKWLILAFHRIDEEGNGISVRHELLFELVKYLESEKIPVVTMQEGVAFFNSQQPH